MRSELVEPDRFERTAGAVLALALRHPLEHHAEHDVLVDRVPWEQ